MPLTAVFKTASFEVQCKTTNGGAQAHSVQGHQLGTACYAHIGPDYLDAEWRDVAAYQDRAASSLRHRGGDDHAALGAGRPRRDDAATRERSSLPAATCFHPAWLGSAIRREWADHFLQRLTRPPLSLWPARCAFKITPPAKGSENLPPLIGLACFTPQWLGNFHTWSVVAHGMHTSAVTLSKDFAKEADAETALETGFEAIPQAEPTAAALIAKGRARRID